MWDWRVAWLAEGKAEWLVGEVLGEREWDMDDAWVLDVEVVSEASVNSKVSNPREGKEFMWIVGGMEELGVEMWAL